MTSINYNEFQAGQGVSAPDLNENFTLTNNAIENLETIVNSAVTSLTSTCNLKADKNGSSAENFKVADATEDEHAVNLGQLNEMVAPLTPVGTVIWYAGASVPDGYLLCDGSAVSREIYSDLFAAIGIKYGAGDSTTTFELPKLADNRFIEGASVSGVYKNAGLPNITGGIAIRGDQFAYPDANWSSTTGAFAKNVISGNAPTFENTETTGNSKVNSFDFNANLSNGIYGASNTVQPKSLTLLPCIKY